jgi:hypothetical protein
MVLGLDGAGTLFYTYQFASTTNQKAIRAFPDLTRGTQNREINVLSVGSGAMLAVDAFFFSLGRTSRRLRSAGKQRKPVQRQSLERLNRLLEG